MKTKTKFSVGDEVICNVNGLGKVYDLIRGSYPIVVKFGNGSIDSYTETGRMYSSPEEDEGEHIKHLTKLEKVLK